MKTSWKLPLGRLSPLLLVCLLCLAGCAGKDLPPKPEDGVLIYAALNPVSEELQKSIERFNASHEDAQIEVRDYSDEGGVERLFTELTLGMAPDIMELHRLGGHGEHDTAFVYDAYKARPEDEYWMPYRQMAQKGYLEDLWPYIESDQELKEDGLLMQPLKASEVDGGLYMLFRDVSITTMIAPEHIVGERWGWTLDELMETYVSMPEGSTLMRFNCTRWDVFSMIFAPLLSQYVDIEAGETSFDSQDFRDMLEFLSAIPEKFKTNLSSDGVRAEIIDRMLEGEQLLEAQTIAGLGYLSAIDLQFRSPAAYVGFPTEDGSFGSYFNLHGSKLAMSSSCRDKEAAWEFMRQILSRKFNDKAMLEMRSFVTIKICVNRVSYEQSNEIDQEIQHEDKNRFFADGTPADYSGPLGARLFREKDIDEEDLARFEKLVNSTTRIYWPDDPLSDLVWDSIGPYFSGDKTMDEVIDLLQRRAKLYVNEQR